MTILPRAASCQRPSADLLAQKLEACNLNKIFFPGYTVVACVRTRESLTLKLETTEPAICPKCGESCIKIHDTRYRRHGGLAPCADSASQVQLACRQE